MSNEYIKGIRHGIKICEMRDVESLDEEFQKTYEKIIKSISDKSDKTLLILADHCNPKKVAENAKD